MKIETLTLNPYQIPMTNGQIREGVVLHMTDTSGNSGWGEIAPLPRWSLETLEQALLQLSQYQSELLTIDWSPSTYAHQLQQMNLFPSVLFGLEAALLSILTPLPEHTVATSALLMGSPQEILHQANLRYTQGFRSAKLKVSNLTFKEAADVIGRLKDRFHLRIDVNRAWDTSDSLRFFQQFALDAFDYVEEPFQNPYELHLFSHPLAVDESFPNPLSLSQLEALPTLKALIYKPTLQGGLLGCLPLHQWATKNSIDVVLSSCFESAIGLCAIASMAHRLSLLEPIGIGTYHYLQESPSMDLLRFDRSHAIIKPKTICYSKILI